MTRTMTGLCAAAAFGCAVTLGAQATSTDQTSRSSKKSGREMTVTGCIEKSADGSYLLMNASSSEGSSTTGTTGSTSGTPPTGEPPTAGTPPTTRGGSPAYSPSGSAATATTWRLVGGKDLDKHVGHKIEVTGRADSSGSSDRSRAPETSAAIPPPDPSNPATPPTAGVPPTPAGTSGAASQPKLEVSSIKMISSSCQ